MEGVAPVSQGRVQLCNNFSSYIHNKHSENADKLSDTKRDLNCIPHFHCVHLEFVCAAGSSLATCVVVSSAFRGSANNPSLSVHVLVISTKIPSPPPREQWACTWEVSKMTCVAERWNYIDTVYL